MKNLKKIIEGKNDVWKLQIGILFIYVLLILSATIFMTVAILGVSNNVIKTKVSGLIAADSRQLQMNINTYLETVEDTMALLFAEDEYYQYDATDESIDDYTKIKIEDSITDRIVDLGLIENFADFGIIYANDDKIGWISNITLNLFSKGEMYGNFAACITNEKTNDGWAFGVGGAQDRMYYVKRFNENAILVASFYSKELASVFEFPEELDGMVLRLIDEEHTVVYSSVQKEIGTPLNTTIDKIVSENNDSTVIQSDYLININTCENGWKVVCSIPNKVIFKELNKLRDNTLVIAIVVALVFVALGLILIHRVTKPVNGVVTELELRAVTDQLSGHLNKSAFEVSVTDALTRLDEHTVSTFLMLDMDNFKKINDNLGHEYGDEVIVRFSELIRKLFTDRYTIGRVGGDEFSLYHEFQPEEKPEDDIIREDMDRLFVEFSKCFAEEYRKCGTSLSVGIVINRDKKTDFDDMYRRADAALYHSKRSGKNQYTIYREGMQVEKKI
jgi:diguanylate cyclase (GGDEF)-like protein